MPSAQVFQTCFTSLNNKTGGSLPP